MQPHILSQIFVVQPNCTLFTYHKIANLRIDFVMLGQGGY